MLEVILLYISSPQQDFMPRLLDHYLAWITRHSDKYRASGLQAARTRSSLSYLGVAVAVHASLLGAHHRRRRLTCNTSIKGVSEHDDGRCSSCTFHEGTTTLTIFLLLFSWLCSAHFRVDFNNIRVARPKHFSPIVVRSPIFPSWRWTTSDQCASGMASLGAGSPQVSSDTVLVCSFRPAMQPCLERRRPRKQVWHLLSRLQRSGRMVQLQVSHSLVEVRAAVNAFCCSLSVRSTSAFFSAPFLGV